MKMHVGFTVDADGVRRVMVEDHGPLAAAGPGTYSGSLAVPPPEAAVHRQQQRAYRARIRAKAA